MKYYKFLASRLTILSSKVLECYKKIAEYEANGQAQAIPEVINEARRIIVKENQIYDSLKDNTKLAKEINDLLFPQGELFLPDELEFVKGQYESDLILIRVGRRLSDILLSTPFEEDEIEAFNSINFDNLYEDIGNPDDTPQELGEKAEDEDIEEEFSKEAQLILAIEDDIIRTILVMLNSYMQYEANADIKPVLAKLKAYLALIYPDIERFLLDNSFEAPNFLVWTSYITGNSQAAPSSLIKSIINDYIVDIISNQLDAYYNAVDETEPDIKKVKIVFTEIVLRSCMIFFNDQEIETIRKRSEEDLNKLAIEPDINASLNMVFKNRKVDSSLPYILNLDPNFFN